MTATIREPDRKGPRHKKPTKRKRARFSAMESLGFIDVPLTATTRPTDLLTPLPPRPSEPAGAPQPETLADWHPNETTGEYLDRRVRWGMIATLVLVIAGMAAAGVWLWQRPAAMAQAAISDVTSAARALEPELVRLGEINVTILETEIDASAISAQSLAVDAEARELFNASGSLPATATTTRSQAAEVATTALDASRLISDAVAYRSAVISILVAPDLETDPQMIGLDDAIRGFGEWQQEFDRVRSALPTGTMASLSAQLELIAGNLESIQGRYIDGLRDDDRLAAEEAIDELTSQLGEAEVTLTSSLEEVQSRVADLVRESLQGLRRLLR